MNDARRASCVLPYYKPQGLESIGYCTRFGPRYCGYAGHPEPRAACGQRLFFGKPPGIHLHPVDVSGDAVGRCLARIARRHFVNRANLVAFLALGNIDASTKGVSCLGIPEGEPWLGFGADLSFFLALATTALPYLQFRHSGELRRVSAFIPRVLLFSATNAFSEEVVYRLGVMVPLAGQVDTAYILLFSAVAFGVPHLRDPFAAVYIGE